MSLLTFLTINFLLSSSFTKTSATCIRSEPKCVEVEKGEDVHLHVSIEDCQAYWSKSLLWQKSGDNIIGRCYVNYDSPCFVEINTKFRMKVNTVYFNESYSTCHVSLDILNTTKNDSGNYKFFRKVKNGDDCMILVVNLTVRETNPICSTILPKDSHYLKMSCEWVPRDNQERVTLVAREQALHVYDNKGMVNNEDNLDTTNSVSTYVAIEDVVSQTNMPDGCIVSKLGVDKVCKFSIHVEPSMTLMDVKSEQRVSFKCCTEIYTIPSVWVYWKDQQIATGRFSALNGTHNISVKLENSSENADGTTKITPVCGKDLDEGFTPYSMADLLLHSSVYSNFVLSTQITREGGNEAQTVDEEVCEDRYNVTIMATPQE